MEQLSNDFEVIFTSTVADALGIPYERVTILRIVAGSVIIEFSVRINESEITALTDSGVESVQAAIVEVGAIGGHRVASVQPIAAQDGANQNDPCATSDWQSCKVAGQPLWLVAAVGLGASVVLLFVLCKLCCKKRAKVGMSDYAQWN